MNQVFRAALVGCCQLLMGAAVVAGCGKQPPRTCNLDDHVKPLVEPNARDCGTWDLGEDSGLPASDCAIEAMDAGQPFVYRLDYLRSPGFEEEPFEPYPEADVFIGIADGGGWNLFFDSRLGGRVEQFRCGSWRVHEGEYRGNSYRQLRCNTSGHQQVCSYQYENQKR